MVICVPADEANKALSLLTELGETAWHIGDIDSNSKQQINIV
jgi:phosphoribosylaminoimidazole (AIR) synthetase